MYELKYFGFTYIKESFQEYLPRLVGLKAIFNAFHILKCCKNAKSDCHVSIASFRSTFTATYVSESTKGIF